MTKHVRLFGLIVGFLLSATPYFASAQDEGYYIYSLAADSAGEIPGRQDFTTSMTFTDRLNTAQVSVTFGFEVANPSEKVILDPDELVEVDFTATLEENTSGVEQGYTFTADGFEIVSIDGETGTFPGVGSTLTGNATLRYIGGGAETKHWFKLAVTDPIVSRAEISEMWCSDMAPNPVIQTVPDCSAACVTSSSFGKQCDTSLSRGATAFCPENDVQGILKVNNLPPASIPGCVGCGTVATPNGNLPSLSFSQVFVPTRQDLQGSFGAGVASNFDFRLEVFEACPGLPFTFVAAMFDPDTGATYLYRNSVANESLFKPDMSRLYGEFELVDDNGDPITDMENLEGSHATLQRRDGYQFELELVDMLPETSTEPASYAGRLTAIRDRLGFAINLIYREFTPEEIEESPTRQLQIASLNDPTA